ncbi:MAG: 2Fe-2S iron-sulfur cluster binding domain-containing protein [Betaproteobacteria bacterium]|nr:MAG: 2Fe-2S iron-sulfur cluster binding domain-containing protein [Betaproteobacteria bacterium]
MNRAHTDVAAVRFTLNGRSVHAKAARNSRLADVLRDELGLTGTKIGCNAGDCGACTVLLDGRQVCSCLTSLGQVEGRSVVTVEGLNKGGRLAALQVAFQTHGAAQCGICTPGMLMAAADLLGRIRAPDEQQVRDALGGVLCRCTGYQKIVEAVLDASRERQTLPLPPEAGQAVGARAGKVDGIPKLTGGERYAADAIPADALWLKVIRSPHHRARFRIGKLKPRRGIVRVLTAGDVPSNGFGIYPNVKDQPVLAEAEARYRGEAVAALIGTRAAIEAFDAAEFPVRWEPLPPVMGLDAAMAPRAHPVQPGRPDNLLLDGGVRKGDVDQGFADCACVAEDTYQTAFVEHAYLEPEAGWARRVGNRVEIHVTTQTPYMDRDEVALILRLRPEQVRIVPSACGGGFGGKLDLSVQPLIALGAWLTGRAVACVYTRPESMASSTKRHPARIRAKFGCDAEGRLLACEVDAVFDTGAYASWGPTVATRVPIHASGPYGVPNVHARGRAYFTHCHPSGAFRGFGVPQVAIAHEALMDALAAKLGIDRLEIRRRNALKAGDRTATGQVLEHSAGLAECLDALRPHWERELLACARFNGSGGHLKHGTGIGCMWYGIGNTSLSNPSTLRVGLARDGTLTLYNGAVDIGQGSNTILVQIAADALGLPMSQFRWVMGDTDRTADAGKTSASRQAFISGKAAELAGLDLRRKLFAFAGAPEGEWRDRNYRLSLEGGSIVFRKGGIRHAVALREDLRGEGRFDPPTTAADENGQGTPYATYAFAAQIATVEVDLELGTTRVLRLYAAHDVGRAINPIQVEGQIQGGAVQGLGLALMEEYVPGRTENLHDYLIPTVGDVPQMECLLVEDAEPLGPYGAKGVGEPGLIPTAPAILGAIEHAAGVRMRQVPVLPHRLLEALNSARS